MSDGRRRAVVLAGHQGDEAAARSGLAAGAPEVRSSALGALSRMGALTAEDLRTSLEDAAASVRRRACELASAFVAVDLLPALHDAEPSVVEAAAWALGERGEGAKAYVGELAALATGHDDPLCREAAVAALGAIGDERGLAAILSAANDRPAVRRRAVIALAPFEGPKVDGALRLALGDRDWQVRQAAEDLLADPDPPPAGSPPAGPDQRSAPMNSTRRDS